MKTIYIFTDGACRGNPGPGGWGAVLQYNGMCKEISGGEADTTNNRMELSAPINALALLKEACHVVLTSDSRYVLDGLEKGWAKGWREKGWIKSDRKPALNSDLWGQLLDLAAPHKMEYRWIKGHAGHLENERCDELAVEQAAKFK